MVNPVGPQRLKIGGEANGEVEDAADSVVEEPPTRVDGLQEETEEVVLEVDLGHRTLTHWHVIAAGARPYSP